MMIRAWRYRAVIGALMMASFIPGVRAADGSPGTIVGVVTNSAKLPVAQATVTAVRTDGSGIRATISGSDGVYAFADLPPGTWSITAHVDGFTDVVVPALEVVPRKATRSDVVMNDVATGSAVASTGAAPSNAVTAPASSVSALAKAIAAVVPEALQAPDPA